MTEEGSRNSFSIRGYVAEVRQRDIEKCWPFHPKLIESRLKEGVTALLPSLEVRTFKYWKSLAYRENDIHFQENSEQKRDISEDNTPIDDQFNVSYSLHNAESCCVVNMQIPELEAKSLCLLREDETYEKGEAQHLSEGIEAEETISENGMKFYIETDGRVKQFASDITLVEETSTCNNIFSPAATSNGENGQCFSNANNNELVSEFWRLNIIDKVNILQPASGECLVERTDTGNRDESSPQSFMEQFINETLSTSLGTTDTGDNKQDFSMIMRNKGALPKLKGESKRLIEKNKRKKRLMADVRASPQEENNSHKVELTPKKSENCIKQRIHSAAQFGSINDGLVSDKSIPELVTSPFEEILNDKTNNSSAVQYTPEKRENEIERKKILNEQRLSNSATHNLRKLKMKRKCPFEANFGSVQKYLVHDKSISESFTSPAEQIVNDEKNDSSAVQFMLDKRDNDIEQKKILNKQSLSNAATHDLRKVKRKSPCGAHFGSVQNDFAPDKLIPESFAFPFEQIGNDQPNDSSAVQYTLQKRENDIEQERILNEKRLSNAGSHKLRKFKVKRKCPRISPFGSMQNELVHDKSISESFSFLLQQIVNDKTSNSSAVQAEKIDSDIKQKKIWNEQLSNAAAPNLKRLKAKRKYSCGAHFDYVQNDLFHDKSISESFTFPFEQIVNDEANNRGAVQENRENDIQQKKMSNEERLPNAVTHNLRKLKVKRKCPCGAHFGPVQNDIVCDKSISESFASPIEQLVNNEKNDHSTVKFMLEKIGNDMEPKKILNEQRLSNTSIPRNCPRSAHLCSVQNNLIPDKLIPESFTSPFEQIVNEEKNDSSVVQFTLEKRENDIEQKNILNQQGLSNVQTHDLWKPKVKRKCLCGAHIGSVQNNVVHDKSICESFTSPFEQIVNDMTNDSSAVQSMLEKRENDIEQKKILNEERLSNAVRHNLRKLKVKRKCPCGAHFGSLQNNLVPDKSESFTSPFEQTVNDETHNSRPVEYMLEKRQNDIKHKKIFNKQMLSNAAPHNLRKLKVKGKCRNGAHFGSVQKDIILDNSIIESFTSPFEQVVNDEETNSSAVQYNLKEIENAVLQKRILNEKRLSNPATHNLRKLEQKKKCHCEAHFGYMQNCSNLDKSDSESLDIKTKNREQQLSISFMSSSSMDTERKLQQKLLENTFSSVSTEYVEASQIQGTQQAQSPTIGSSVPVSGGFAVDSLGSSVANLEPVTQAHVPNFASECRKKTFELPLGAKGWKPQKKQTPARSNNERQSQETKKPERSKIVVLALPAISCTKI